VLEIFCFQSIIRRRDLKKACLPAGRENEMKKSIFIILFLVLLLGFLKAGYSKTVNLSGGEWHGTWASNKTKQSGGIQFTLKQHGSEIFGNIIITNSPVTKGGEISGSINGNALEFGLVKDKLGMLKYAGTVSEDSMTGTWEISILKDRGMWQAKQEKKDPGDNG